MLASSQRLLALRRVPWLAELPLAHLTSLQAAMRERAFPAGSVLAARGQPARHVHVIADGQARSLGYPSAAMGMVEVLARDPDGLETVATSDVVALELRAEDLADLLEDSFPLILALIRGLARATGLAGLPAFQPPGGCTKAPAGPLDLVAKTYYLRQATSFARGRLEAIVDLAHEARELRLRQGDVLWREGEPSSFGVLVIAGGLAVRERARARLDHAPAGTVLGFREVMAGQPRDYDAVATADTTILRVDGDALFDVLEDQVEVAVEMAQALAAGLLQVHRASR